MVERFNGLRELLTREDAGRELLALHQNIDLDAMIRDDLRAFQRFSYLEFLLSRKQILNTLNSTEQKALFTQSEYSFFNYVE